MSLFKNIILLISIVIFLSLFQIASATTLNVKSIRDNNLKEIVNYLYENNNCPVNSISLSHITPSTFNSQGENFLQENTIFVVKPGTYQINTTQNVGNCSSIVGTQDGMFKYTSSLLTTFAIKLGLNSNIYGIFLDGNGSNLNGVELSSGNRIEKNTIIYFEKGIVGSNSIITKIIQNEMIGNDIGISLTSSNSSTVINNNKIKQNILGIELSMADGTTINETNCILSGTCIYVNNFSSGATISNTSVYYPETYGISIQDGSFITIQDGNFIGNKNILSKGINLGGNNRNTKISGINASNFNVGINSEGIPSNLNTNVSWSVFNENENAIVSSNGNGLVLNNITLFNNINGLIGYETNNIAINNSAIFSNDIGINVYGSSSLTNVILNNSILYQNSNGLKIKSDTFNSPALLKLNETRIVSNGVGLSGDNTLGLYYGDNLISNLFLSGSTISSGSNPPNGWSVGNYGSTISQLDIYSIIPVLPYYQNWNYNTIGRQIFTGSGAFDNKPTFLYGNGVLGQNTPVKYDIVSNSMILYGGIKDFNGFKRLGSSDNYVFDLPSPSVVNPKFISENSATIEWTGSGATFDISKDGGKTYDYIGITTKEIDLLNLAPSKVYLICVRSVNIYGIPSSCGKTFALKTNRQFEITGARGIEHFVRSPKIDLSKVPYFDGITFTGFNKDKFDVSKEDINKNQGLWKIQKYLNKMSSEQVKEAVSEINGIGFIRF